MSIVRVGMGENQKYSDGFNAIFGKKKSSAKKAAPAPAKAAPAAKKPAAPAKKPAKKK